MGKASLFEGNFLLTNLMIPQAWEILTDEIPSIHNAYISFLIA